MKACVHVTNQASSAHILCGSCFHSAVIDLELFWDRITLHFSPEANI